MLLSNRHHSQMMSQHQIHPHSHCCLHPPPVLVCVEVLVVEWKQELEPVWSALGGKDHLGGASHYPVVKGVPSTHNASAQMPSSWLFVDGAGNCRCLVLGT